MLEQRFINTGTELRASQGDEGAMIIAGRAASFGTLSENLGNFRETIRKGCFTRSLQSDRDVKALYNHDASAGYLGRTKNKTLYLHESDAGLNFRCELPDTQSARDIYTMIQRRDIDSCSFAFEVDGEDGEQWSDCDDPDNPGTRMRLRTLLRAKLHDVSVLTASPAYPTGTSVEANKLTELNSLHRSTVDYFPAGVPVSFPTEVRAVLLRNQNQSSHLRAARQKLFSLILS